MCVLRRMQGCTKKMASDAVVRSVYARAQEIAVLLQHFNGVFGYYALSIEILGIVAVVVNTTLAVIYDSGRAFIISLAALIILLHAYKSYGAVYEESKVSRDSWMSTAILTRQYRRAYRPGRISIGSFFHADRSLILTMLSIILNHTLNLVLAVKRA